MGVGYVFTVEFIGPKWRSVMFGMGFWDYGTCMLALLAWGLRDWRHLAYLNGSAYVILIPAAMW